jgi:hypothetical protein
MSVNVEARALAAGLLRRFARGDITQDQLEDAWPRAGRDVGLEQVRRATWYLFDDLHEHRAWPETIAPLERYASFLESGLEYEGPALRWWQLLLALPLSCLTLGRSNAWLWPELHDPRWPFPR